MLRAPALVLPDGMPMPLPYRWLHAHGIVSLTPWHFIDKQASAIGLRDEFLKEVGEPNPSLLRDWIPFARHQAQDDFAGFELVDGEPTGAVYVVHLTWKQGAELPGWPGMELHADFWHWFTEHVIPETIEQMDEGLLPDLLPDLFED